jgi:hypothetical protein
MSDEEEEEPVSNEEKLGILRYFITNSPPGHEKAILEAAKKLNMEDVVDNNAARIIFHEYNTTTNVVLKSQKKDGYNFVVDKLGEMDADRTEYLFPRKNEVYTIDHLTGDVSKSRPAKAGEVQDEGIAKERKSVEDALFEYATKNYERGMFGTAVFPDGKKKILNLVISCHNKKLSSFWSGRWQSHWTVGLKDGKASIFGDVRVLAHYFEGGNVQMSHEKDFEEVILDYKDAADLATVLIKHIDSTEMALQKTISAMYGTMEEMTKNLRRLLPMNRQKFDWTNYAKYEVADQYSHLTVSHAK